MFALRKGRLLRVFSLREANKGRHYHTYPDPNEIPIITSAKSTLTSVAAIPKNLENLLLNSNASFSMDASFPGFDLSSTQFDGQLTSPPTRTTKLSNGLTVATQDTPSLMTSFAFAIGSGSASEKQSGVEYNGGSTHMIETLAFKSTFRMKEHEIKTKMENLGGMVQCVANRESILFCIDVLRANIEPAMELLGDTVLCPHFSAEALEAGRESIGFMSEYARAEVLSRDAIVQAAYVNQPLGNFHMCPAEKLAAISEAAIQSFRAEHLYGENCVLSAAGIDHESLVKIAERIFKDLPTRGTTREEIKQRVLPSIYSGGLVKQERELKEAFIKVSLGFEVGGWNSPHFTTVCVLQSLLGGGSSFSAGGPGKGMYSRLYRDVLNRHYWVEGAEAFVVIHDKCGLLGIDGACTPEYAVDMLNTIIEELIRIAIHPVDPQELARAKNMLKSMLLMQLESRLVLCEDIARQHLTYGLRRDPMKVCREIDAVTAQDIQALGQLMIKQNPAVGCIGADLSTIPSYERISSVFAQYRAQMKQRGFFT